MRPNLKLFVGDNAAQSDQAQVSMPLRELTSLLLDAVEWDRAWLTDFNNEEVKVSPDLYDVLAAYSHLRPSA